VLEFSFGFHFREKRAKLNGVCKNYSFGTIWILLLFEVITAAILEISPCRMILHPPRNNLHVVTPHGGVRPSRSFLGDEKRILKITTHNGCYYL